MAVHNVLWGGNELARRFYFIDYQYSRRYPLPRTTAPPIHPLWRYGIDGEGSMNPFEVDVFRLGDLLEGICRMLPVRRGSEVRRPKFPTFRVPTNFVQAFLSIRTAEGYCCVNEARAQSS